MVVRYVSAAIIACALPAPAHAQVDAIVEKAMILQQQGRTSDAFELLAPYADARAGDPDFDYVYGLAAADSGRTGEAIAAFQRVLALRPNNAQARAEIARLYAQAGDIDTARSEFNTVVQDPSLPDPVRQRVGGLIKDYDARLRGGADSVTGFVDADVGYDSNVNSATALTSITLPVFSFLGPATLGGAASRMDDGFYQVQAGFSAATALSRQNRLFASAIGSWRDNFRSDLFDQAAVTATGGIAHTSAQGDVISFSSQAQRFWLGRDGYRTGVGAIAQYTGRLRNDRALSAQLQYFRFNYDGDPTRDANRHAATLTYADRSTIVALGGGSERTARNAARNLGYRFAALQGGTERSLNTVGLKVLVGGGVEHRAYRSLDPLFLTRRSDTQLDATLGVHLPITQGFGVRPRLTFTRNFSNVALYDFTRATGSIGVRLAF